MKHRIAAILIGFICLLTCRQAQAQWLVHDAAQDEGNILQTIENALNKAHNKLTEFDLEAMLAETKKKYIKECEAVQWAIKQYDTLQDSYNTLERTYSFINRQIGTVMTIKSFFEQDYSDPSVIRSLISSQASSLRNPGITYNSQVVKAADTALGQPVCEPIAEAEKKMYGYADGAIKVSDEADKASQKIATAVSVQDKGVDAAVKDGSATVLNLLHAIYKTSSYSGQMLNRTGVTLAAFMREQAAKDKKEAEERLKAAEQTAKEIVQDQNDAKKGDAEYRAAIEKQQGNKYIDDFWSSAKPKYIGR